MPPPTESNQHATRSQRFTTTIKFTLRRRKTKWSGWKADEGKQTQSDVVRSVSISKTSDDFN